MLDPIHQSSMRSHEVVIRRVTVIISERRLAATIDRYTLLSLRYLLGVEIDAIVGC